MLTVNTVLQTRYRITRQLGQGGMGAVYEAIDERLDKTVAIKEILLELENAADKNQQNLIKQAFRREANSLVKARHEAVPDVTDYFSEFEREFLVMEFIEGDDLMKLLQIRKKPYTVEEVSPWIDQLLVALNYLHNLSPPIIHRDIKPQNLKINQWHKIKLLDFGVAKNTDKAATITQMTFIGATLSYSPIEQIIRVIDPMFRELILLQHREKAEKVLSQNTDSRCDIFAIGATFYHLLTNRPPVDVTKRALESWEGKGDPLPNPTKLNPDLPASISDWLLKSMAIEREERFASAVEMRKSLHAAISESLQKQEETTAQTKPTQEKEEYIPQEQDKPLMQAETVRLIELPKTNKTEQEITPNTLASITNESKAGSADTFSSLEAESTDFKFTDTDISNFETSDQLTELLHIDANQRKESENQNTNVNFVPPTQGTSGETAAGKFNYFMILPIVGIFAFVIFGGGIFGVMMLMNSSETPVKTKSTVEKSNANIVKTPEALTTLEANITTPETNLNSETVTNPKTSNSPESLVNETPNASKNPSATKPGEQSVKNPVVIKDPPKTVSTPIVKKPASTPKKKNLSDDCIFNNNCN